MKYFYVLSYYNSFNFINFVSKMKCNLALTSFEGIYKLASSLIQGI